MPFAFVMYKRGALNKWHSAMMTRCRYLFYSSVTFLHARVFAVQCLESMALRGSPYTCTHAQKREKRTSKVLRMHKTQVALHVRQFTVIRMITVIESHVAACNVLQSEQFFSRHALTGAAGQPVSLSVSRE